MDDDSIRRVQLGLVPHSMVKALRVPFVLMVLSLKLLQVIRSRRPSLGTSTPRTEVRVSCRWPVAMRRALSAYSVNLLFCTMYEMSAT